MNLTQAKVVGDARAIPILTGQITELFKDRREASGTIRVGDAARRRKLPTDLEPLVGTGQLWVTLGFFEVRAKDIQNWGKSVEMFIVAEDITFRITKLSARATNMGGRFDTRNPDILSWNFAALVQPNDEQLERIRWEMRDPKFGYG
jgi:hypothetical protein